MESARAKPKSFISDAMMQFKTKRVYTEAENAQGPHLDPISIIKDCEDSLATSKSIKEPILCKYEEGIHNS